MKKKLNARVAFGMACSVGLAFGLSGSLQAALTTQHNAIVLMDYEGNPIPASGAGSNKAYSAKKTCGTAACHDYNIIERHSTHAQLGANGIDGWSPWNPDSKNPDVKGCNYMGKEWTQTYGHTGKW